MPEFVGGLVQPSGSSQSQCERISHFGSIRPIAQRVRVGGDGLLCHRGRAGCGILCPQRLASRGMGICEPRVQSNGSVERFESSVDIAGYVATFQECAAPPVSVERFRARGRLPRQARAVGRRHSDFERLAEC